MKILTGGLIVLIACILHSVHCNHRSKRNAMVDGVFNTFCREVLNGNYARFVEKNPVDKSKLHFVLKTLNETDDVIDNYIPITNPEGLVNHPQYRNEEGLVIFISGFMTNLKEKRSNSHDALANAYVKHRTGVNFATIDTADYLSDNPINYYRSAILTLQIAENLAASLKALFDTQPRVLSKVHLVGHSLGAQICGKIGRILKKQGIKIPRITGLDPAGPCFYEQDVMTGLYKGDAQFVDVIHTNPETFGKKEPVGDADFYPNGSEDEDNAPGCGINKICSHARAWQYFAETVVPHNGRNFLPTNCTLRAKNKECEAQQYPMGFYAQSSYPRGKYFLHANSECPFGRSKTNKQDKRFKEVCNIFIAAVEKAKSFFDYIKSFG